MSEKMPSGNEGEVNQSRRGFLKGALGLGAVATVGGAAYLASKKEEEPSEPSQEAPYATPVEELTREEIMKEIVHDVSRAQMLEQFRDGETMSGDITLLDYFLQRAPSREEVEAEIATLHQRIVDLRAHRDSHKPL